MCAEDAGLSHPLSGQVTMSNFFWSQLISPVDSMVLIPLKTGHGRVNLWAL